MTLHLPSFLAGFWVLWLLVGLPLAVKRWGFWRRTGQVDCRFRICRALDAVFLWPWQALRWRL